MVCIVEKEKEQKGDCGLAERVLPSGRYQAMKASELRAAGGALPEVNVSTLGTICLCSWPPSNVAMFMCVG